MSETSKRCFARSKSIVGAIAYTRTTLQATQRELNPVRSLTGVALERANLTMATNDLQPGPNEGLTTTTAALRSCQHKALATSREGCRVSAGICFSSNRQHPRCTSPEM